MKKRFSVIMVLAVFLMTTALAEVTQPAPELNYVEKVLYMGNGLFEIEFMRNVPWRTDYVLTAKDDADSALTVSVIGGDANDAFVWVEGDIRQDTLYTFTFVANDGVIPAIGQSTIGFSYANHCEYCMEFGHDEMACAQKKAAGISYDVDRCDICGELGHEDDVCPERQPGVVYCDECAGTGHDDDHCPYDDDDDDQYERCDDCGVIGHDDDSCPNHMASAGSATASPAGNATARPEYCDECREYGHDDDECPNERCDDCGAKGHDDDRCPSRTCKRCGEKGHSSDDCPTKKCDECGQTGHDDDDCPNERCDECGKYGHDDDHCPNHKGKHHDD